MGGRLIIKGVTPELDTWLSKQANQLGLDKETYARSLLFQALHKLQTEKEVSVNPAPLTVQELAYDIDHQIVRMPSVKDPDDFEESQLTHGDYGAFGLIETPAERPAPMNAEELEAYIQSRIAEATANQANEDPFSTGVTPLRRAAPRRISETSGPIEQRWKG